MKLTARHREIAEQVRLIREARGDQVHDRHRRGFDALHLAVDDEQCQAEQGGTAVDRCSL